MGNKSAADVAEEQIARLGTAIERELARRGHTIREQDDGTVAVDGQLQTVRWSDLVALERAGILAAPSGSSSSSASSAPSRSRSRKRS